MMMPRPDRCRAGALRLYDYAPRAPSWAGQGLADAATLISNHIGQRGLPQLMHHDFLEDEEPA